MNPMTAFNDLLFNSAAVRIVSAGDGNGDYGVHQFVSHAQGGHHQVIEITARHQGAGKWDILIVETR